MNVRALPNSRALRQTRRFRCVCATILTTARIWEGAREEERRGKSASASAGESASESKRGRKREGERREGG